jgi:thymidylate kinase
MQIQLEGCEASGKSTLLKHLKTYYQNRGYLVTSTHFPTMNTPFGVLSHKILNQSYQFNDYSLYITLLAIADQKEYNNKFKNILDNPKLLTLTSRGLLSTLVYSDLYEEQLSDFTKSIYQILQKSPKPDIIIYLKPTVDIVIARLATRRDHSIYDKTNLIEIIQKRYTLLIDWLEPRCNILTINIDSQTSIDDILKISTDYINLEPC